MAGPGLWPGCRLLPTAQPSIACAAIGWPTLLHLGLFVLARNENAEMRSRPGRAAKSRISCRVNEQQRERDSEGRGAVPGGVPPLDRPKHRACMRVHAACAVYVESAVLAGSAHPADHVASATARPRLQPPMRASRTTSSPRLLARDAWSVLRGEAYRGSRRRWRSAWTTLS